ncbi:MAG: hypothetical protein JWN48_1738, partial [Myxococcaceae bacterium]|nr:hypothetical protein [Myxococcaceae bacterium]
HRALLTRSARPAFQLYPQVRSARGARSMGTDGARETAVLRRRNEAARAPDLGGGGLRDDCLADLCPTLRERGALPLSRRERVAPRDPEWFCEDASARGKTPWRLASHAQGEDCVPSGARGDNSGRFRACARSGLGRSCWCCPRVSLPLRSLRRPLSKRRPSLPLPLPRSSPSRRRRQKRRPRQARRPRPCPQLRSQPQASRRPRLPRLRSRSLRRLHSRPRPPPRESRRPRRCRRPATRLRLHMGMHLRLGMHRPRPTRPRRGRFSRSPRRWCKAEPCCRLRRLRRPTSFPAIQRRASCPFRRR